MLHPVKSIGALIAFWKRIKKGGNRNLTTLDNLLSHGKKNTLDISGMKFRK